MGTEEIFEFGEFRVDTLNRTLRRNDATIALNRRAFDVLLYLVKNPGRVVTKDELLRHVWPEAFVEENNLTQSISVLRKALEERRGENMYIATLPGRGYQFTAPVHAVTEAIVPTKKEESEPQTPEKIMVAQEQTTRAGFVSEALEARESAAPRRQWMPLAWAGALIAVGLAAYLGWRWSRPSPTSAKVVIAAFQNTTGDAAFDGTLERALAIDLGQSPYMDVMSEPEVVSTLQFMGQKSDTALTPELARQVCERNNRKAVLTGSVASVGKEYLLTLDATDCVTGKKLAAAKAEAMSKEEVLGSLDAVADRVRSKLGESSRSVGSYQVPIVTATTSSLDALKAYSLGVSMAAQGRDEFAVMPLYQRAVDLDSHFAMAWSELATQYYNLSEYKEASEFYRKAFELSDHVSAKESLVIRARYYAEGQQDLQQGIKVYQLWTATYPNDWVPWNSLANEYTRLGQYQDAVSAGQRALQLEPNRPIVYTTLVRAFKRAGRYDEAKALAAEALRRNKGSSALHGLLYVIACQEHDADAIARETEWGAESGWYATYLEALNAASEGKYGKSKELFHKALSEAEQDHMEEDASSTANDEAAIEILFGLPAAAKMTLRQTAKSEEDQADLVRLQAALGDIAPATAYLAAHGGSAQPGTLVTYLKIPLLRARIALSQGKPLEAIEALEAARPYEISGYEVWAERGAAYLQAKQPELAASQYKNILDNESVSFGPLYPLAHLGRARALAMSGKLDESRAEYETFLSDWKDADGDLPVLKAAKAELMKLPSK